jgi:hypothetical protein
MDAKINRAVALGFNTRSDMAKEPTAATTDKSMIQIQIRRRVGAFLYVMRRN